MTPRGRKPKSAEQKKLEGNPGKRQIKEGVKLTPALPDPPEDLTPRAAKEWNRVAPELFAAKILTNADRAALAMYCQAWADWENARIQISDTGMVIKLPTGYEMQSPWVAIANRAQAQVIRIAAEFGLTPAARVRLAIEKGDGDDPEAKREKEIFGE